MSIETTERTQPHEEPGFPSAIPLPDHVRQSRSLRTSRLMRVASIGVAVRLLVAGMELSAVWLLGHALLLVDGLATLGDVAMSVVLILAIKLAQRPPDKEHPFGHGRYEPLAGLQLGVLICLLGGWLLFLQCRAAVYQPHAGNIAVWACAIPLLAAGLLEGCYHLVRRTAQRENCTALLAEAYHYRIDALTSLIAAGGLLAAAFLPAWGQLVDHLGAMVLAAMMVALGAMAARENLHQLLDRAPSAECIDRVRASARSVPGVQEIEKVRIQTAGPTAHVNIDVEVDPDRDVKSAHDIAQRVRAQIQTDWPAVRDVVVHVEPYYEGDH